MRLEQDKTTVIELISRFYDVTDGEVLIGGQNIKDIAYDTLLNNIPSYSKDLFNP